MVEKTAETYEASRTPDCIQVTRAHRVGRQGQSIQKARHGAEFGTDRARVPVCQDRVYPVVLHPVRRGCAVGTRSKSTGQSVGGKSGKQFAFTRRPRRWAAHDLLQEVRSPPIGSCAWRSAGEVPPQVPAHSVPPAWRLWRAIQQCDQRQVASAFPCTNNNQAGQCQLGAGLSSRQMGDHLTSARSKTPASPAPSHPGLARPRSQRWNAWPTSDNPHPQPWRPDWQR